MRFLPTALLNRLRRNEAQDPLEEEDIFEEEANFENEGGYSLSAPKIALAVSGALFALLLGGITTIIITGDSPSNPAPVMGSLADLEIVEETETSTISEKASSDASSPNAIVSTDRSAARRPWLNPTAPAENQVADSGMNETPQSQMPTSTPAVLKQEVSDVLESGTNSNLEPETVSEADAAARVTVLSRTTTDERLTSAEILPENKNSLADAGPAPGAPKLFGVDREPATDLAGGRPRLTEPALPPTEKEAVAAPPPRYANISGVSKNASLTEPSTAAIKIAVVVEGLGLSEAATETAILKLPSAITLAFSPYSRDLKKWINMAKEHGHEVLIEVPMESKQFPAEDPGPLGLLTSLEEEERKERLETILEEAKGAVGIIDTMGSHFRESSPHINFVFNKLREENLYYVQGRPGVRVGEANIPTTIADVVIDERPFRAAIDARLDYAERLAKYQGSAVAALRAKPVSFERLVLWMEQISDKDIGLAPISQVLIR